MSYIKVDVLEQQLEDLVRRYTGQIENGLIYVQHQRQTDGGRLDVLLVDSGNSLVVAELKATQNDGMLFQGLDYYDYVAAHVESYARLYEDRSIDPVQQVRLFLIAPSFSQTLVNRCKWLDLPISLFTYVCVKFEGNDEVVPIFSEQSIPTPVVPEEVTRLDDHLAYITDASVRAKFAALLEEIKNWKTGHISLDSIKYAVSVKVDNQVFAYLHARRKHYLIETYNTDNQWSQYPIQSDSDLAEVKPLMKAAMEARLR